MSRAIERRGRAIRADMRGYLPGVSMCDGRRSDAF